MTQAKEILENNNVLKQALTANPAMVNGIISIIAKRMADEKEAFERKCSSLTLDYINVVTNGYTPLVYASLKGYTDVVIDLIKKGADVNVHTENGTALFNAANLGRTEIVKILLKEGANVNLGGYMSPLQVAAKQCYPEIVRLLIDNGADIYAKDPKGKDIFALVNIFPHTYELQKKTQTIEVLNTKVFEDYSSTLNKRPKNERYDSFKHDYGFFCLKLRPFGFSVQEKMDASEALKNFLLGNQPPSSLAPHLKALKNGKLGQIFERYVTVFPELASDNILSSISRPS